MQQLRLFFAMEEMRRINAIVASCWIYFTKCAHLGSQML